MFLLGDPVQVPLPFVRFHILDVSILNPAFREKVERKGLLPKLFKRGYREEAPKKLL